MPKKSVYLPSDLATRLAARPDINLSAIVQAAVLKALDPDITTEALITATEDAITEQAEAILDPAPVRLSYAKSDFLALAVNDLTGAGAEIVSVSYDGVDHCILWRSTR